MLERLVVLIWEAVQEFEHADPNLENAGFLAS